MEVNRDDIEAIGAVDYSQAGGSRLTRWVRGWIVELETWEQPNQMRFARQFAIPLLELLLKIGELKVGIFVFVVAYLLAYVPENSGDGLLRLVGALLQINARRIGAFAWLPPDHMK